MPEALQQDAECNLAISQDLSSQISQLAPMQST